MLRSSCWHNSLTRSASAASSKLPFSSAARPDQNSLVQHQMQDVSVNVNLTKPRSSEQKNRSGWQVRSLCENNQLDGALDVFKQNPDPVGATSLISAYGWRHQQSLDKVFLVYQILKACTPPDAGVVGAVISACRRCKQPEKVLSVVDDIENYGVPLNQTLFGMIASVCNEIGNSDYAAKLVQWWRKGFKFNPDTASTIQLIQALGMKKSADGVAQGRLAQEAFSTFCSSSVPPVPLFVALVHTLYKCDQYNAALSVMDDMQTYGVVPNEICFGMWTTACSITRDVAYAQKLFHLVVTGKVTFALADKGFGRLIKAFLSAKGQIPNAVSVLNLMDQRHIRPSIPSYCSILTACANEQNLEVGEQIYKHLSDNGTKIDNVLLTSLMNMFVKCNQLGKALSLWINFSEEGNIQLDSQVYSVVLTVCIKSKDLVLGQKLHTQITHNKIPIDNHLAFSLISMYGTCGDLESATSVFSAWMRQSVGMKSQDIAVWNSIIAAHTENKSEVKAVSYWNQLLQKQVTPNNFTYTYIMAACATLADDQTGLKVCEHLLQSRVELNTELQNGLINLYSKIGNLEEAEKIFLDMSQKDMVTWSTMMAAYGLHGHGKKAIQVFEKMVQTGISPDSITMISILSACGHSGLVDQALQYFHSMETRFNISPTTKHIACIVDGLARLGRLEIAEQFIQQQGQSDVVAWKALLGSCRLLKNVTKAEYYAAKAWEIDPMDAAVYVMLGNIYSQAKRHEDANNLRRKMDELGVKKIPGKSYVTVDGETHSFVAGDTSHPQHAEIYKKVLEWEQQLPALGYSPDTSWVLQDLPEEEKEDNLCVHSEKLALAFALLKPRKRVVVTKNLRVCGNCHHVTKYIAKLENCEVVVRDAKRFHHYQPDDLACSCKDFW